MYGTRLQKATGKHHWFARGVIADFGRSCLPGLDFAACHVFSACDATTLTGILTVAQATIPVSNALNAKKQLDANYGRCKRANGVSRSRTQVSLLPPPCDELTIMEPSFRATRVSPPGRTKTSSPNRMKGRRSTCLGARLRFSTVGTVDNVNIG